MRTVTGSAAHPSVLKSAGIEDADMLIAVTQQRRNQPGRVQDRRAPVQRADPHRAHPRARSSSPIEFLRRDCFAVDYAICPEQLITDYLVKLVEFPEALQVLNSPMAR